MNDILAVALADKLEKDTKKVKLAPGRYDIDETVTLHITGTLTKGKDTDYTPTVKVPMLTTMALILEKAGFQRENAKILLIDAMREAMKSGTEANPVVAERVKDIEEAMTHVREVTDSLPRVPRQGATTVKVTVEELEPANL